MKILCISDLHLEFERREKHKFYIPKNINKEIDVLILAGDISTGASAFTGRYIDRWLIRNPNMHIIYVPGNHEYYGKDLASVNENLLGSARKRSLIVRAKKRKHDRVTKRVHVFTTGKSYLKLGDYLFTGGTLWTDFNDSNPLSMMQAKNFMNDYRVISGFTPEKSVELHNRTLKEISNRLRYSYTGLKKIVVTHHAPSHLSVPDRYKSSTLNHAYYSNLDDFILSKDIDLWVHGHTHDSFDYNIGKTRVYCNPRGYVGHELNPNFSFTPIEI